MVFNWVSLNIHKIKMKHLFDFQMNVFNYPDFFPYWIPREYFFKQLHLTVQGHLK